MSCRKNQEHYTVFGSVRFDNVESAGTTSSVKLMTTAETMLSNVRF